jgi:hypothetical protein
MVAKYLTHRRLRQPAQQAQQLQPPRRYPLVVVRARFWLDMTKHSAEDVCLIQSTYRLGSCSHLGFAGQTSSYSSNPGISLCRLAFLQGSGVQAIRVADLYGEQHVLVLLIDSTYFKVTSCGESRRRGCKGIEESQARQYAGKVTLHIVSR